MFFLVTLMACNTKQDTGSRNTILVSILPQKTFVEKIAGTDFNVIVLIPPGSNPSAYSLSPSLMADVARSVVWFRIGHIGFEYSWGDNIARINREMKVIDLSAGLDLIKKFKADSAVNTAGYDPHTWLSPAAVKKMSLKIMETLTMLNPDKKTTYKNNFNRFILETDSIDVEIKKILYDCNGKTIIVFHPSLSYFARDYGLKQVSLEPGGKEPTPESLLRVIETAKTENIGVIYIQGEVDKDQATIFAEETGGKIIRINPLDPSWSNNLLFIAKTIRKNME